MRKVLASACVMAIAGVLATASIGVASKLLQARENIWLKTCFERADNHQGLQLQSCDMISICCLANRQEQSGFHYHCEVSLLAKLT